MKSINTGYAIRAFEIVTLAIGLYWLVLLDAESVTLIWFLIIVFISLANILLSVFHPSKINLFYAHHLSGSREKNEIKKAISKVRRFIPMAITIVIFFYLYGINFSFDEVEWKLFDVMKMFYVCSYIIYQFSFLRGAQNYISRVENLEHIHTSK